MIFERFETDAERAYLRQTPSGFAVDVYHRYGTHGSALDWRRYFYGKAARARAEHAFDAAKRQEVP